jgi:hypothetical protein
MSRCDKSNDQYLMAFGVDHTPMGCFFQIWKQGEEKPGISVDELYGIKIRDKEILINNPTLKVILDCFLDGSKSLRNEEHICQVGRSLGLDIQKEVWKLWD